MTFHIVVFLLSVCHLLSLALLRCLDRLPLRPSSPRGGAKRSSLSRLLKPRSPDDCPCTGYLAHPFEESHQKTKGGETKSIFFERMCQVASTTFSQGIGAFDLRHARYRGLENVHLQQVLTATAFNVCRMYAWLTEQPRVQTRQAAFVRLLKKHA